MTIESDFKLPRKDKMRVPPSFALFGAIILEPSLILMGFSPDASQQTINDVHACHNLSWKPQLLKCRKWHFRSVETFPKTSLSSDFDLKSEKIPPCLHSVRFSVMKALRLNRLSLLRSPLKILSGWKFWKSPWETFIAQFPPWKKIRKSFLQELNLPRDGISRNLDIKKQLGAQIQPKLSRI